MKMNLDELKALILEVNKQAIEQLSADMQQQLADLKSQSAGNPIAAMAGATAAADPQKGLQIGCVIRSLAAAKGDPERAAKFAAKWGNPEVEKILSSGDGVAGGFTVAEDLTSEVIELLRPATTVRGSQPVMIDMPNGSITMPGIANGSQAGYAGETQNGGTTEPDFRQVKLTFKKLIALVPVSNDLLRYSNSNVDGIVRDDLVSAMAQREDLAFLRGDGVNDTPTGIFNLVPAANSFAANATVNLANVTTDLGKMVLKLLEGNSRMIRPTWFMAPRTFQYLMDVRDGNGNYAFRDELLKGSLQTWPVKMSNQIPVNLGGGSNESEMYLVDMADALLGESQTMTIDASGDAAYHDGSQVQAAFSKDQTVIRAIAEHDFNMRHRGSIAVLTAVKWGV